MYKLGNTHKTVVHALIPIYVVTGSDTGLGN